MSKALIFGVSGQDGGYLSQLLMSTGTTVVGTTRDVQSERARELQSSGVRVVRADVVDGDALLRLITSEAPDLVFNLAGESSVAESWRAVQRTTSTNAVGALNVLEALRVSGLGSAGTRFFQASSSEMIGDTDTGLADEHHLLAPRSPYGVSKAFAHHMTRVYRESYGVHASSGILFNHESPLRDARFVTKKIVRSVVQIAAGTLDSIRLGNLDARRDWSFAGDVVDAMVRIVLAPEPDDYIIASGQLHSVRDFIAHAFAEVGIRDWECYVRIDTQLFRPNDIGAVAGDATKARANLGWTPKVDFEGLVKLLVASELNRVNSPRPEIPQPEEP